MFNHYVCSSLLFLISNTGKYHKATKTSSMHIVHTDEFRCLHTATHLLVSSGCSQYIYCYSERENTGRDDGLRLRAGIPRSDASQLPAAPACGVWCVCDVLISPGLQQNCCPTSTQTIFPLSTAANTLTEFQSPVQLLFCWQTGGLILSWRYPVTNTTLFMYVENAAISSFRIIRRRYTHGENVDLFVVFTKCFFLFVCIAGC